MYFLYYAGLSVFLVLSLLLMLLVLIQKGRGGGLSAAFGGVGGNTAFGAKTGDVLTWATSILFALFLTVAIGMNLAGNYIHHQNTRLTAATQPADATAVDATPTDAASNAIELPPAAASPTNPTPVPPPTPTTNPSTKPTGTGAPALQTDRAVAPPNAPAAMQLTP